MSTEVKSLLKVVFFHRAIVGQLAKKVKLELLDLRYK